jgi:membrane associated rhomboid family serine protease
MFAAVGRLVVRRLGTPRFVALAAATAIGGAAAHLVFDWGSGAPMIGASGVVFGLMGATLRFAFTPWWGPPPSVIGALRVPRVRGFIAALVLMNLILVVFGAAPFGGDEGGSVAWAAHLGGFLVGFFGFRLFDRPWRPAAID